MMYSKPDDELVVTNQMESYRNIPELMKGKFPGVEVIGPRPNDPEYLIYIRGVASVRGPQLPLVLIDGIEADFKDLTRIPVSEIDRIDILKLVSSTVIYGFRGANGVINLITKAGGRYADNKPDNLSAKLRIYGYNAPRIFYSPQHLSDSASAFKPDLRYTIYWNPDINLEGNKKIILKYYNGDNSSLIRVIAEGITTSGIPITGKTEYEVK